MYQCWGLALDAYLVTVEAWFTLRFRFSGVRCDEIFGLTHRRACGWHWGKQQQQQQPRSCLAAARVRPLLPPNASHAFRFACAPCTIPTQRVRQAKRRPASATTASSAKRKRCSCSTSCPRAAPSCFRTARASTTSWCRCCAPVRFPVPTFTALFAARAYCVAGSFVCCCPRVRGVRLQRGDDAAAVPQAAVEGVWPPGQLQGTCLVCFCTPFRSFFNLDVLVACFETALVVPSLSPPLTQPPPATPGEHVHGRSRRTEC